MKLSSSIKQSASILKEMLKFSIFHKGFCGNIRDFRIIRSFCMDIWHAYSSWHGNGFAKDFARDWICDFFPKESVPDILRLKDGFDAGKYTADETAGFMELVLYSVRLRGKADCADLSDAEKLFEKRMEHGGKDGHGIIPFHHAVMLIYANPGLEGMPFNDKFRFDMDLTSLDMFQYLPGIKDDSAKQEGIDFIVNHAKKHLVETRFPGMYSLCIRSESAVSAYASWTIEDMPDTGKVRMVGDILDGLEPDDTVKISSPSYTVQTDISMDGVSIKCRTYKELFGHRSPIGENIISPHEVTSSIQISFGFDGGCRFAYGGEDWQPATMDDLSLAYRRNRIMASIIQAFMDAEAAKGSYIWKDMPEYLATGYVLPLPVDGMAGIKTKNDLICKYYGSEKTGFYNWNKGNLYYGYVAMDAMEFVEERDHPILFNYVRCTEMKDIPAPEFKSFVKCTNKDGSPASHHIDYDRSEQVLSFLEGLILSRLTSFRIDGKDAAIGDIKMYIHDYIMASLYLSRRITLRAKSVQRIKSMHDRMQDEIPRRDMPCIKIPKNSAFRHLRELLPDEFEWITTKDRLLEEGKEMKHCVSAYAGHINSDKCAIYSFIYGGNGKRYTVEFNANKKGAYALHQIKGKCNEEAPREAVQYVERFLS